MSLAAITGGNKEAEKPKLTLEQQKRYDDNIARFEKDKKEITKIQQTNVRNFPQIFTPQYTQVIDDYFKDGKKFIEDTATLTNEESQKELQTNKKLMLILMNFIHAIHGAAFYNLYILKFLPTVVKTNADEWLLRKKITDAQKKQLDSKADEIQKYYDSITTKTPLEEVNKNYTDFRNQLNQLYKEAKVEDPLLAIKGVPYGNEEETKKYGDSLISFMKNIKGVEKKIEAEKAAERASFSPKRLASEILSIMGKTVASLLIVMLFFVSGMLAANDAIGRDWKYRVLYFFYGGLGFPIMLLFYLYRWFVGTAPTIYRLIPIYTEISDTTLGRFLWFPFTYEEDDAARKAKTDFMTKAAELVGKKYSEKDGAGGKETMSGVLKAMEALGVSKEAAKLTEKGVNALSEGAEATAATLGNVMDKMKSIDLPERASFAPVPLKS